MEAINTTKRIHPLVAVAAVSVTLVSLTGVAAITGILPNSHSTTAPATALAPVVVAAAPTTTAVPQPVTAPVAAPVATLAPAEPVAEPEVKAAPPKKVVAEKPARKPERTARASEPAPRSQPQPYQDYRYNQRPVEMVQAPVICTSCGRVESVETIQQQAQGSGLGVVAGALIGGALGNKVGGGNGRKLATVAGAIGGGFAGNEAEKRMRASTTYQVRVRMDDGSTRMFPYTVNPGWQGGEQVRVVNGELTVRG